MIRMFVITVLNMALPFVLRFLYLAFKRWWVRRQNKKLNENKPLPSWSYPWKLVVIIALGLTMLTFAVERLFMFEQTEAFERIIPKSKNERY